MGSSGSKGAAAPPAPSGEAGVRSRSFLGGSRVFSSSCLGLPSVDSDDQDQDQDQNEQENGSSKRNMRMAKTTAKHNQGNHKSCSKRKISLPSQMSSSNSSSTNFNEEGGEYCTSHADSGASSSSGTQAAIARPLTPSCCSRSPFCLIPAGISFRLGRTASLGSSGAHSLFSTSFSVPDRHGGGGYADRGSNNASDYRNGTSEENNTVDTVSSRDVVRSNADIEAGYSQLNHVGSDNFESRRPTRRLGSQEPLEGSIRFSRTRSVGRLRDRVLRRTTFSEGLFGSVQLEDGSVELAGHGNRRQILSGMTRQMASLDRNAQMLPASSSGHLSNMSSSMGNINAYESEIPQLREADNHDILERRSTFLERRRRIRSQVRALQRLGSRFESLSGHDRYCVLCGQHRTGRCTCRLSSRAANIEDGTSTRASISRIVMLAEALFEVLDEIHQQAVVLASRPSVSSLGSIPAPKDIVESMPVKIFTEPEKHQNEEDAQCYVCLVEYEEGDCVRILPCHHEFHQMCIDKWLKEIHRVCPLCRGDVCKSEVLPLERLN